MRKPGLKKYEEEPQKGWSHSGGTSEEASAMNHSCVSNAALTFSLTQA